MKRVTAIFLAGSILMFVISAADAASTITFDEFPVGTMISNQYAPWGVIFHPGDLTPGLPIIDLNIAMPTEPVLRAQGEAGGMYIYQGDFWIEFSPPVLEVEFISGYWDFVGVGIIDVFDPSMIPLTSLTNTTTGVNETHISGMGSIGYIYFNSIADGAGADIDNLTFNNDIAVDIKPTSCPNPLNVKSQGVLPVAILGTEDFDVSLIDPDFVLLAGVAPLRFDYEDVATPFDGELCDCHEVGPDGYLDMTLKFDAQGIVDALGLVVDGEVLSLPLTGFLDDGTPIEGSDCIRIIKKGNN